MSLAADTPAPQAVWASLDRAQRSAAYDNNAAVANSATLIEARNAASATYRKAHPGGLDIPYAPRARTAFDLYPAPDPRASCLVFVHGGYWLRNSRELFAAYAEGLALAGWSIAIPGYTLAPEASLNAIVAEIGAALDTSSRMLRESCKKNLGIGPSRYRRLRGMQRVHRMLRGENPDTATLSEVARRCGFRDLGGFAANYQALYGELPSATLRGHHVHGRPHIPKPCLKSSRSVC